jgi:hypothetical protein
VVFEVSLYPLLVVGFDPNFVQIMDRRIMAHPGFKKVQSKIQGEGYSKKAAGAILASATRKASASAKAKNPKLKKVK